MKDLTSALDNPFLRPLLQRISRRFDLGWYPSMTAAFFRIDQLVNAPGVKYNPDVLSSATSGAHLPLIAKVPHMRHAVAEKVWGAPRGEPAYYRIAEMWFDDRAAMDRGNASPEQAPARRRRPVHRRDQELHRRRKGDHPHIGVTIAGGTSAVRQGVGGGDEP